MMMVEDEKHSPAEPPSTDVAVPLRSEELLGGRREVQILHQGQIYRLLVTRNGKLILQK